jgi:multimeric flavodoxin WrbA
MSGPHETVTVLNGLREGPVWRAIQAGTAASGLRTRAIHHLGDAVYAPCKGCFECWTKTPGQCGMRDAANPTMEDAIAADVLLVTTRVRFGTVHPLTKAALDRMIGLISPFFQVRGGETHHRARYGAYPHWAVVAVTDPHADDDERALFVETVRRMAVDLHSPVPWVCFVSDGMSEEGIRTAVRDGLAHLADAPALPSWTPVLPSPRGVVLPEDRAPHAVVWVGSAKPPGTSASENLGAALAGMLETHGWTSEVVHARRVAKLGRGRADKLVEAFQRADLVILATPVYVDTLPALVLEGLSDLRGQGLGTASLLPIVQCGFPELLHTETALASLAMAAGRLGLSWAGHLALGGGGIAQRAIEPYGPLAAQHDALTQAAAALADGRAIDEATRARFAEPYLSERTYRLAGHTGWFAQAWKHGAITRLWDQPFRPADEP